MYNETYGYNREIAWYKNDKNVKCDIIYICDLILLEYFIFLIHESYIKVIIRLNS